MNTKEKRDKLWEFSLRVYSPVPKIGKFIPLLLLLFFFLRNAEYKRKTGQTFGVQCRVYNPVL